MKTSSTWHTSRSQVPTVVRAEVECYNFTNFVDVRIFSRVSHTTFYKKCKKVRLELRELLRMKN